MQETLKDVFGKNIDVERIMDHLLEIYRNDRWFDNPHFHTTANYCRTAFKEYAGCKEVQTFPMQANGETCYGDYIIPQAWEAHDATCSVVRPEGGIRTIADYRTWPNSLFRFSAPTPQEGVEAEIVFIEGGDNAEDYKDKEVRGKIVFNRTLPFFRMWRLAAQQGAIGIINCWRSGHGHQWENHIFVPKNEHKLFGFSINEPDADWLEALVKQEAAMGTKVMARVGVDTRLYNDTLETITAVVPGKTDEEILVFAHLYEIGALDNASGAATVLEMARCINALIEAGTIAQPRRTIRFMLGNECYSLTDYLLNYNRSWDTITAGITPDQFGVSLKSPDALSIVGAHDANANFGDLYLTQLVSEHLEPYGVPSLYKNGGSDNDGIPSDPCYGIPFPYFSQDVRHAKTWHNSSDVPEKIDKETLHVCAVIAVRYVYGLACAELHEAQDLLHTIESDALKQLHALDASEATMAQVAYIRDRACRQAASVVRLTTGDERVALKKSIATTCTSIHHVADTVLLPSGAITDGASTENALELRAQNMVFIRNVPGLLTLDTLPEEVKLDNPLGSPVYQSGDIPLLWIDGKRNLLEIYHLYQQQGGTRSLEEIVAIFEFLKKYEYIGH